MTPGGPDRPRRPPPIGFAGPEPGLSLFAAEATGEGPGSAPLRRKAIPPMGRRTRAIQRKTGPGRGSGRELASREDERCANIC